MKVFRKKALKKWEWKFRYNLGGDGNGNIFVATITVASLCSIVSTAQK